VNFAKDIVVLYTHTHTRISNWWRSWWKKRLVYFFYI